MDDQEAIKAAIQEFIEAYNAGDLPALMAYYTDDLIKIRHGAPETKHETAQRVTEVFSQFSPRVEVAIDEIGVSGEIAFARGSLRVTLVPKSAGEPLKIERRYLEIWRKEGGRWLVARTMDNIA